MSRACPAFDSWKILLHWRRRRLVVPEHGHSVFCRWRLWSAQASNKRYYAAFPACEGVWDGDVALDDCEIARDEDV